MAHGRRLICKFTVVGALTITAAFQGCGRLGYDPLISAVDDGGSSNLINDGGLGHSDASIDGAPSLGGEFSSGQYLGTGISGLKITGVGFAPDVVLVHARTKSPSLLATRLMSPGRTRVLSDFNANATSNIVTSFGVDGFELGAMTANVSGVVGDYVALKATPGSLAVGRFVGDGQTRNLTGLGFSPGYVFVACDGRSPMHRSRTMDTTIRLSGNAGGNLIASLDVDGFSLGSAADVNQTGSDCQWFAVREAAGVMTTTMFIGNDAAGRLVMLPGSMPMAVFVQCDAVTGQQWVWKPLSLGADTDASYPLGNTGPEMNLVQRLLSGGFGVGSEARVNAGGQRCHAVAFGG